MKTDQDKSIRSYGSIYSGDNSLTEEAPRVAALDRYKLLDGSQDPVLDTLVAIAAEMTEAPIAVVTLLDEKEQWLKAKVGLNVDKTPKDISFYQFTVSTKKPLIVENALLDDRFNKSPLVIDGPKLRSYAGFPIITLDGFALGAFAILDTKPRKFDATHLKRLQHLSSLVMRHFETQLNEGTLRLVKHLQKSALAMQCKDYRNGEGKYIECNESAKITQKMNDSPVLGKTDFQFYTSELADDVRKGDLDALTTNKEISTNTYSIREDGTKRYYKAWRFPLPDQGGMHRYIWNIAVDVTEEYTLRNENLEFIEQLKDQKIELTKALQESEQAKERLERAELLGRFGNWELSLPGDEVRMSVGMQAIFFSDKPSVTLDEFFARIHKDDLKKVRAYNEKVLSGQLKEIDIDYRIYDEQIGEIYLRAKGTCEFNSQGEVTKAIGTTLDCTNQKILEKELISKRNEALAAADAKSAFLANMSHEIRNPLHSILGNASILEKKYLPRDVSQMVEQINFSGETLLHLINDILDFSKFDSDTFKPNLETVNLPKLLENIRSMHKSLLDREKLTIELVICAEMQATILIDKDSLKQILINLVNNAIKFSSKGPIQIEVKRIEDKGTAFVEFHVKDQGIGIAEKDIGILFEKFSQVESPATKKVRGSGLGLAICKTLCEKNKGTIWVESKLGYGSAFCFRLPFEEQVKISTELASNTRPFKNGLDLESEDLSKRMPLKILLVDDCKINRDVTGHFLEYIGYKPDLAESGFEALKLIEGGNRYDYIFMDLHMPKMDGIETTIRIRSYLGNENKKLKIVALTADLMAKRKSDCMNAKFDGFLTKPMMLDDLHHFFLERLDCTD